MSATGYSWNNALVEVFFSTFKHKLDLGQVPEQPTVSNQTLDILDRLCRRIGYEQQFMHTSTLTSMET